MKKPLLETKVFRCAITLLPYIILFILTKMFFNEVYLLDWLARRWYYGLWIITAVLAVFNFKLSFFISCANIVAITLGQVIGDILQNYNISQITPDMTAEQQARLYLHYGVFIWIISLLVSVAMFALVTYIRKKKAPNS